MATLRELKGRIGSVASSEKITGAMKMISSAKMHKAEGILRRLVPFRDCVQTIIGSLLSSDAAVSSPLMTAHRAVGTVALVALGSDDGLCGAYNVNILKGCIEEIAKLRSEYGKDVVISVYPVGKKLAQAFTRLSAKDKTLKVFPQTTVDSKSEGDAVKDFAQALEKSFLGGETDVVRLCYMHYLSAGRQRFLADDYLPISAESLGKEREGHGKPYLFEPDAPTIFATALPMYLLSKMQGAFAENRASEQAARVMAMQSANDNAQKLLEQLQLEYNKLRQQGITTELLDIVGGQARD